MKKENIYVEITNETERLKAIEILQNAGENIWDNCTAMKLLENYEYLILAFNGWFIADNYSTRTKITLDELETLLNPKKSNVFIEVQEWIRENCPEREYTFVNRKLPECFKRIEQHLKNDYPQGTEIKISKDKIEIYHS
jgi:uncharacterized protein (DUF1786 family)